MNNNLINSPKSDTNSAITKDKELNNSNKSQDKSCGPEIMLGSEFYYTVENQVNGIQPNSSNSNQFSCKLASSESEDADEIEKPRKASSKSKKSSKFDLDDLDDDVIEDYLNNISDKEDLFNMAKLSSVLNLKFDDNLSDNYEDIDEFNLSKSKNKSKYKKNNNGDTKGLSPEMVDQLRVYNQKFTNFIKQNDVDSMQLPPINNKIKSKVISLTKLYNLQCNQKSTKNRKKHLLITKTPTSNYITEGVFLALCNTNNPKPYKLEISKVNSNRVITKSGNGGNQIGVSITRQSDPDKRIDEGNKGHKLLSKLGWTPGTSIGANNTGILDPVEAYKIKGRSGLGLIKVTNAI
ncbi:hypothetical protein CONCODRAFT_84853 [Conidiobolus coronatus NRRL 28638]|uniref:G-patch domain-containing protein n=1 Tax=Conidiobolus coronatus (strain ATCC 28846 / CBS 209.66 / NRRL 28638) TaxID=796925 RepID=A0A137P858_CONC2|nr:hypothetical protein CONCODRAFT_84853 [Conidiobolus coronatus NRRL 28638]|eukprot:KXN71159.1 hypothetical protein CONCODRAFT_84853 [Conidiobolus coronatus NRRL 28638]